MNRTGCTVSTGSLPDPCNGVVKSVAIEATCSGSPGGAQVCRGGLEAMSQGWDSLLQASSHPCLFFVSCCDGSLLIVCAPFRSAAVHREFLCYQRGRVPLARRPLANHVAAEPQHHLPGTSVCFFLLAVLAATPRAHVWARRDRLCCVAQPRMYVLVWYMLCCDVQPGNSKGFLNATEAARWG